MFAAYANFYQPPEQFKLTVSAYVEKIATYPLSVVSRARVRITDRERAKPPNAGELVAECERVQFPCCRKFAKASEPRESPKDPVMVARVGSMMADLSRQLAANAEREDLRRRGNALPPDDVRKDADAKLAALHAERHVPVALSPQAKRAVGIPLTAAEEAFLQESLR